MEFQKKYHKTLWTRIKLLEKSESFREMVNKKVKYSKSINVESEVKKINNIDKTPPENSNKKELQNDNTKSNN